MKATTKNSGSIGEARARGMEEKEREKVKCGGRKGKKTVSREGREWIECKIFMKRKKVKGKL